MFLVKDGRKFLFAGDSITDCHRRQENPPLGTGYASLFAGLAMAAYPERHIEFINRGVGGNTSGELAARWRDDVIRQKPDWISILIGINDINLQLSRGDEDCSPDRYLEHLDYMVGQARKELDCEIVLMDPFYMSTDTSGWTFRSKVMQTLTEYRKHVLSTSKKHSTMLLPLHEIFQHHIGTRGTEPFCQEPVHPYQAGHQIIAWNLYKLLQGELTV
ncbi:MAG TPA: GDSL family lipase [Armatimonadetes bacterium]|nr:GDSL family lipase [Armatimonadota bacterium]